MILTHLALFSFLNGAGGGPTPPVPTPVLPIGGIGHGSRRRRVIKLRNGRVYEVENDQEIRDVVQHIINERVKNAELPPDKRKISKKIRQRPKLTNQIQQLSTFNDWSALYDAIAALQMSILTEQILLDLIRNTLTAESADESDVDLLLLLM